MIDWSKCPELAALWAKRERIYAKIEEFQAQCPHPADCVTSTLWCPGDLSLQRFCERCRTPIGHASIEQYREHNASEELRWWRKNEREIRERTPHLWKNPPYLLRHPNEPLPKTDEKSAPQPLQDSVRERAVCVLLGIVIGGVLVAIANPNGWL